MQLEGVMWLLSYRIGLETPLLAASCLSEQVTSYDAEDGLSEGIMKHFDSFKA